MPAVVIVVAIFGGIANGAIPASFIVSGTAFKVSAKSLDGTGFVQYSGVVTQKDGKHIPVIVSGIHDATLKELCQSVAPKDVPVSLMIRAGRGNNEVHATDMLIDMSQLSGDATFHNIHIGQDASTLDAAGKDFHGLEGGFGQQADDVHIKGLHQVAWSTTAGTFTLDGLDLSLSFSKEECFT